VIHPTKYCITVLANNSQPIIRSVTDWPLCLCWILIWWDWMLMRWVYLQERWEKLLTSQTIHCSISFESNDKQHKEYTSSIVGETTALFNTDSIVESCVTNNRDKNYTNIKQNYVTNRKQEIMVPNCKILWIFTRSTRNCSPLTTFTT